MAILTKEQLQDFVAKTIQNTPITDIHTHLYAESFGDLLLWGIDELLTYHYLIAESLRYHPEMPYEQFWEMTKSAQADFIWQTLFIERSPYSEACRGVITVLHRLGLDVAQRDLESYREYFRSLTSEEYIDVVFKLANVSSVTMTNDPFDDYERAKWEAGGTADARFQTALRIDPLLIQWEQAWVKLRDQGYEVTEQLTPSTIDEVKRFLHDWIRRIDPLYMAVSLPADFMYPEDSIRCRIIDECIIPIARENNIPFAMMIGVTRQANPFLRSAGDSVAKSDISAVEAICRKYPDNKFLVTMLSRENQHELAVTARKFRNLLVFGCWWFLNNPSLIEEITRMRIELLGSSVIPQHSDSRILDQLLYKWDHSRAIIGKVLNEKYADLLQVGWRLEEAEIERDIADIFGNTFWKFIGRTNPMLHS